MADIQPAPQTNIYSRKILFQCNKNGIIKQMRRLDVSD
jgi:hypothetical protein